MKLLMLNEFKRQFKSFLLWAIIIITLSVLMLSLYPAFKASFAQMEDLLSTLPQGFLDAFGLGEGGLSMSEPYGWFGTEGYLFVVLIGGSYAGILGSGILSKEEDDKTIEFLLSKPISRNQILIGKACVVLINLLLLNIVMFIVLSINFAIIADYQFVTILLLSVGPLLLEVVFASVSFAISVFMTKSRTVISTTLGLVIGLYFLDVISTLTDKANFLKYFSPYEYVNAVSLIKDHTIEPIYLLLSFLIVLSSALVTWYFYNRKDIIV